MAYADEEVGSRRLIAISIVAALHAAAGFGITVMGFDGAKQIIEDLQTFDVAEEKPEEPEKPPPPPEKLDIPPPPKVTAPPPVNVTPVISTNTQTAVITPSAPPAPPPPPPAPPPPPPPPAAKASRAEPKGSPGSWATNDDYPSSAIRAEESGTTSFRLEVGADGKVTGCSVTGSSGSSTLDEATCRLVSRRARFRPAIGGDGQPTNDTFSSRIRWVLPK